LRRHDNDSLKKETHVKEMDCLSVKGCSAVCAEYLEAPLKDYLASPARASAHYGEYGQCPLKPTSPNRLSHDVVVTPSSLFKKLNMSYLEMNTFENFKAVREDETWLSSILQMETDSQVNSSTHC
jgi:hypothetical protein